METVEMDLMQAQIGSLATDVSRLEAKVAKGGNGNVLVELSNLQAIDESTFGADASILAGDILTLIQNGSPVYVNADTREAGGNTLYMIPINRYIFGNTTEFVSGSSVVYVGVANTARVEITIYAAPVESPFSHTAVIKTYAL